MRGASRLSAEPQKQIQNHAELKSHFSTLIRIRLLSFLLFFCRFSNATSAKRFSSGLRRCQLTCWSILIRGRSRAHFVENDFIKSRIWRNTPISTQVNLNLVSEFCESVKSCLFWAYKWISFVNICSNFSNFCQKMTLFMRWNWCLPQKRKKVRFVFQVFRKFSFLK